MPEIIADIFFLHDRGKWNTLYWVVYMGSLMVGPIVAGSMTETVGWRSFWWFNTGLLGLSFLMVVFMFPETRFQRRFPGDTNSTSGSSLDEKTGATPAETTNSAGEDNRIEHVNTANSGLPNTEGLTVSETAARDPYLGKASPTPKASPSVRLRSAIHT